jgi:hypothetical protein
MYTKKTVSEMIPDISLSYDILYLGTGTPLIIPNRRFAPGIKKISSVQHRDAAEPRHKRGGPIRLFYPSMSRFAIVFF